MSENKQTMVCYVDTKMNQTADVYFGFLSASQVFLPFGALITTALIAVAEATVASLRGQRGISQEH